MIRGQVNNEVVLMSNKFMNQKFKNEIEGRKVYTEIRKDIASQRTRLKTGNPTEKSTVGEMIYVDKTRALAVLQNGDQDLRNQVSSLERAYQISLNKHNLLSWKVHFKEGMEYLNRGRYNLALQCFNHGIEKENDHEELYIQRSITYQALNMPKFGLKDSEEAIRINRVNYQSLLLEKSKNNIKQKFKILDFNYVRALSCKAESLYQLCEFENALVYYYRCYFRRSDSVNIQQGIHKTILSLQNCVNDNHFRGFRNLTRVIQLVGYADENKIRKYVDKFKIPSISLTASVHRFIKGPKLLHIEEEDEEIEEEERAKDKKVIRKISATSTNKLQKQKIADHLINDITFLKRLMDMKNSPFSEDAMLAQSTMNYLRDRQRFWMTQQSVKRKGI